MNQKVQNCINFTILVNYCKLKDDRLTNKSSILLLLFIVVVDIIIMTYCTGTFILEFYPTIFYMEKYI